MEYTWGNIKTRAQQDALVKACIEELEILRKSPKLKELLEKHLEIRNQKGNSSIIIDRNGNVFWHYSYRSDYGFDLDWEDTNIAPGGKLNYKLASEAFVDGKILPWDIKEARMEIER
ncbi:MAG: hypothetical protein AAB966_01960 [Patescibacteria group bacterium]